MKDLEPEDKEYYFTFYKINFFKLGKFIPEI
jgi:hypothetical protein